MILFLTLIYVAVVALLVRLRIIRLTIFWKLSPVLWMGFLMIFLFFPLQWGAPAGNVNVYQSVVEIVPNVTGQVVEVPADGLTPLQKDDVLFQIDPRPYQDIVDQFTAQLADTEQNVERLQNSVVIAKTDLEKTRQQIDIAVTAQESAGAALRGTTAALRKAETDAEKTIAVHADLEVQTAAAEREFNRIKAARDKNAAADSDVDRAQVQFSRLTSQRDAAALDVKNARVGITVAQAKLDVARLDLRNAELQLKQLKEADLPRAAAALKDAQLAAGARIGDEHTSVAMVRAQLKNAEFNLEQTTVRAPSDGYLVGNTLRPGQRVSNLPMRAAMSFVDSNQTRLVVGINQYAMRNIQPGQAVEATLKLYPGRIISGTVEKIAWITPQGQLAPSGNIPGAPTASQAAAPYGIVVQLDNDEAVDVSELPGGAVGTAAIYTNNVKMAHLIRRVMLRMEAWTNYILP